MNGSSASAQLITGMAKAARAGPGLALLQRKCACGNGASNLTGACSDCAQEKALGVPTKLAIGARDDPLERDADRIADQVIGIAATPTAIDAGRASPAAQRVRRATPITTGTVAPAAAGGEAPAIVSEVLSAPGQPLDAATRQFMEPRFGHDFSRVRVHTDAASEQSARDLDAHAYTVRHDIVFAAGRYAPQTTEGRRLLTHELTHVVQQTGGAAVTGGAPAVSAPAVQRQPRTDLGVDRPPLGAGRHRPRLIEADAVSKAETIRVQILDTAIATLGPMFERMRRQRVNEPARAFQVESPVAEAMRALGLRNSMIDADSPEGTGTLVYLVSAFSSLVKNRYGSGFADIQVGAEQECSHPRGTLYAIEGSFGGAVEGAIVLCPPWFGARPECQAFIMMHEYFHRVGLVGHGETSLGGGADALRDEVLRRGYKPGYLVANPSALATFAWVLATGRDPMCSERSEVIEGWPTSPRGEIA